MNRRPTSSGILCLAALLQIVAGCASVPRSPVEIGWPPPPREPMVIYERSIYGSQSIERSLMSRVKDFLFGKSPDMFFAKPYGIAHDGASRLYVVDTGKKAVVILDLDHGRASQFDSLGPHGKLREPVNVALDGNGNVYVADTGLGRVAIFDREGVFLRFLTAEANLSGPVGLLADDRRDLLWVVDTQLHQVRGFDREGAMRASLGARGDQPGEFYHPLAISAGGEDTLYVVDTFHFVVQAFGGEGHLFAFGTDRDGIGQMARPRDIARDSDGHLYVTDALRNNVQIYTPDGEALLSFGARGTAPGQFRLPAGICITPDDRIFVVDSINRRIQQFRYVAGNQEAGGS